MYGQTYNAGAAWEAYLAAIAFAFFHFQVRGYSWYFLSIPLLTILFLSIQSTPNSDAIFGYRHRVYPPPIPWREPSPDGHVAVVIESDSPFREVVEARLKAAGIAPLVNEYGKLAVIEGEPR